MDMSPVHQVWPKPSCKARWKGGGGRIQGRQKKRWEDIKEWTGLEFTKFQRAVEKMEKLVVMLSVVLQRPLQLSDRWRWRWRICLSVCPGTTIIFLHALISNFIYDLITIAGRFSHAFRSTLPFLISALTSKAIEAVLPVFQSLRMICLPVPGA